MNASGTMKVMEGTQMRRAYNTKISERANRSLSKREAQVRMQKSLIAVVIMLVVFIGIIFGTGIHVFAGSGAQKTLHKYYESIRIEEGDTLWDIAGEYIKDTNINRQEYVDEVCELNGIYQDEIHAGDYIVVIYYSTQIK